MLWPINGEIFMKLTNNEIGQKFRKENWAKKCLCFKLIGFMDDGTCVGEWMNRDHDSDLVGLQDNYDWLPYEPQPKQEVKEQRELLMSPSVMD